MKKVLLSEMSWVEVEEFVKKTDLAIIPLGANEVYGKHLPLGSDTIVATELAVALAHKVGAVVSPPIPIGESRALLDFPGTLSTSLDVFTNLLRDCCESLIRHNFKRFFIVNGHVGNVPAVSSIANDLHGKALFGMVDVWRFLAQQAEGIVESDCIPEGHASEIGTSVLMALRPDLVNMEEAVKEVPPQHWVPRPGLHLYPSLLDLTKSGVIGDPSLASSEKGKKIIDKALEALTDYIQDFK